MEESRDQPPREELERRLERSRAQLEASPRDPALNYQVGYLLLWLDRRAEAVPYYREAVILVAFR